MGTPGQTFYIDLDTGSSLLWLQSIIDPDLDPPLPGQITYQPARSIAAIDQVRSDQAKYGDGDLVTVALYKDSVTVGKMSIPSALIGAAPTSGIKTGFQMSKANGILGLGFPTDPANAGRRNLVQTLYDMGLVRHASFALIGPRVDPKLAEKIDKKVIMQPRGTFVIGSVDPAYYTGSIAWCPQIVATNRWIVKLDKVIINGKVAFENQRALIDTGTAYIVASPSNYDKAQTFINGAAPIEQKKGLMFSFPSESLKSVGFVFGGREIRLQPQDFGLGGVKTQSNRMCSSIVKLPSWDFDENLWVIGGIFLDNVVTIFDYGERKLGFADISEKDLAEAGLAKEAAPTAAGAAPAPVPATTTPFDATSSSVVPVPDISTMTIPPLASPPGGRTTSTPVTLTPFPPPAIAVGFQSIDLGPVHIRAITFPSNASSDSFSLNFNAQADITPDPNSDSQLLSGAASWLRALPNDPDLQVGRVSVGKPYGGGWTEKGLPLTNTVNVQFPRKFAPAAKDADGKEGAVKVVLWLSGLDFSKAYNWRVRATAASITNEGFTCNIETWDDSILYKADVCWIAHTTTARTRIESGVFSTNDVRAPKPWVNSNKGRVKFERSWAKKPNIVAGLNLLEIGCGRPFRVKTRTEMTEDSFEWGLDSDAANEPHLYQAGAGWIAIDSVSAPEFLFLCVRSLLVKSFHNMKDFS